MLFCVVRKPADLQDLAPGTNPPFVTFSGEVKVDVNKIEEFLEEKLTPPRYTTQRPTHMNTQRLVRRENIQSVKQLKTEITLLDKMKA